MLPHVFNDLPFVERFYSLPSVDSTSTYAKSLSTYPTSGIYVVQADIQTAGRGRYQNTFFSNVNDGLWASICTPMADPGNHFTHNRALSVAICDTFRKSFNEAPVAIKWPNDIYWTEKKICGILLENIPSQPQYLLIGFGINVNVRSEDFPDDLRASATSFLIETGKRLSLNTTLHEIISSYYNNLNLSIDEIHGQYARLLYKIGSNVEIEGASGKFLGVDPDGTLKIDTGTTIRKCNSGSLRYIDRRET